jgi:hypothetical protein
VLDITLLKYSWLERDGFQLNDTYNATGRYAEFHNGEFRYTECRGAMRKPGPCLTRKYCTRSKNYSDRHSSLFCHFGSNEEVISFITLTPGIGEGGRSQRTARRRGGEHVVADC